MYVREGSDRYCYVGHKINGSMGDNTTINSNEATFNCTATGDIPAPICGATATDYGDAPPSYDVNPAYNYFADLYNNTGSKYLRLGALQGGNEDAPKSIAAGGNNNGTNGDGVEEDGANPASFPTLAGGAFGHTVPSYSVPLTVHNTMGAAATLGGWIDWNGNGTFEASEGVTANIPDATNGTIMLTWTSKYLTGKDGATGTYARFRVTMATDALTIADFGGAKNFGEIEDYYIPFTTPLPVTISSFTADVSNCTAQLQWKTVNEHNSSHYEIEQSMDGRIFLKAGEMQSHNAVAGGIYNYTFNALNKGNNYFRLKAIDLNGTFSYSSVVMKVSNCNLASVNIYPNPVYNNITVSGLSEQGNVIQIVDITGRQILHIKSTGNIQTIDMSRFEQGTYLIRVTSEDGMVTNLRILKN